MPDYFLGEIRAFAFEKVPKGWAMADGSLLSIQQNQALFSVYGNRFGGDGKVTFALPDLRGRVPVHIGRRSQSSTGYATGDYGGKETAGLNLNNMPAHGHTVIVQKLPGTAGFPGAENFAEVSPDTMGNRPNLYGPLSGQTATLSIDTISLTGGQEEHTNMQPFSVVNYCVCVVGIYPQKQ